MLTFFWRIFARPKIQTRHKKCLQMLRTVDEPYTGDQSPFGLPHIVCRDQEKHVTYLVLSRNFVPKHAVKVGAQVTTTEQPPVLVKVLRIFSKKRSCVFCVCVCFFLFVMFFAFCVCVCVFFVIAFVVFFACSKRQSQEENEIRRNRGAWWGKKAEGPPRHGRLFACTCVFTALLATYLLHVPLQPFSKVIGLPSQHEFIKKKLDSTWYQVLANTAKYCKHAPVYVTPAAPKPADAPSQPTKPPVDATKPQASASSVTGAMAPSADKVKAAAKLSTANVGGGGDDSATDFVEGAADAASATMTAAAAAGAETGAKNNTKKEPPKDISRTPPRFNLYTCCSTHIRLVCIHTPTLIYDLFVYVR